MSLGSVGAPDATFVAADDVDDDDDADVVDDASRCDGWPSPLESKRPFRKRPPGRQGTKAPA